MTLESALVNLIFFRHFYNIYIAKFSAFCACCYRSSKRVCEYMKKDCQRGNFREKSTVCLSRASIETNGSSRFVIRPISIQRRRCYFPPPPLLALCHPLKSPRPTEYLFNIAKYQHQRGLCVSFKLRILVLRYNNVPNTYCLRT